MTCDWTLHRETFYVLWEHVFLKRLLYIGRYSNQLKTLLINDRKVNIEKL